MASSPISSCCRCGILWSTSCASHGCYSLLLALQLYQASRPNISRAVAIRMQHSSPFFASANLHATGNMPLYDQKCSSSYDSKRHHRACHFCPLDISECLSLQPTHPRIAQKVDYILLWMSSLTLTNSPLLRQIPRHIEFSSCTTHRVPYSSYWALPGSPSLYFVFSLVAHPHRPLIRNVTPSPSSSPSCAHRSRCFSFSSRVVHYGLLCSASLLPLQAYRTLAHHLQLYRQSSKCVP